VLLFIEYFRRIPTSLDSNDVILILDRDIKLAHLYSGNRGDNDDVVGGLENIDIELQKGCASIFLWFFGGRISLFHFYFQLI
jgi:hypothetical protein